jgi:hypothetical protein
LGELGCAAACRAHPQITNNARTSTMTRFESIFPPLLLKSLAEILYSSYLAARRRVLLVLTR